LYNIIDEKQKNQNIKEKKEKELKKRILYQYKIKNGQSREKKSSIKDTETT